MPVIEVAAGIPCPQTSTVTPEERRLLSEGSYGPRGARTIELDERQFQTLTWALSAAQAAAFRDWYRTTLIYGGAWFSAPATWPTPEGLIVKVRRFLGDPQWTYRGNGHWLLSINAEVRGETLLPSEPAEGANHWLFFNEEDGSEPVNMQGSNFVTLTDPIPFADGLGAASDGEFHENETFVSAADFALPLYSENSLPGPTEYSWAPAGGGGAFEPSINSGNPSSSTPAWSPSNFYIALGSLPFDWTGGVLTLYSGNDITGSSGATVITFIAGSTNYPAVSIEYVGPA